MTILSGNPIGNLSINENVENTGSLKNILLNTLDGGNKNTSKTTGNTETLDPFAQNVPRKF